MNYTKINFALCSDVSKTVCGSYVSTMWMKASGGYLWSFSGRVYCSKTAFGY